MEFQKKSKLPDGTYYEDRMEQIGLMHYVTKTVFRFPLRSKATGQLYIAEIDCSEDYAIWLVNTGRASGGGYYYRDYGKTRRLVNKGCKKLEWGNYVDKGKNPPLEKKYLDKILKFPPEKRNQLPLVYIFTDEDNDKELEKKIKELQEGAKPEKPLLLLGSYECWLSISF